MIVSSARDAFLRDVASALADFPVIIGDGVMHRLKPGIMLLIKRTKATIVPMGIAGAVEAWPRWQPYPVPAPLFLLVDVPAVVHDSGHRRVRVGSDLDQIELLVTGLCERFRQGLDSELLPFGAYEEDLAGSDAVVDPDLVRGYLVTCFIGA